MQGLTRRLAIGAVILLTIAMPALGQTTALQVQDEVTVIPQSIPVDVPPGTAGNLEYVPVLRLDLRYPPSGAGDEVEVQSVTIELTGDAPASDVPAVRVFFAEQGGVENNFTWNGPEIENEVGEGDFSDGPATITFDPPLIVGRHTGGNGEANLYVVFDFSRDANTDRAVGARITDIQAREGVGEYQSVAGSPWETDELGEIDSYQVTLDGTSPAEIPEFGLPGDVITALQLDFDIADASLLAEGHTTISQVRVTRTGTAEDTDARVIRVFADRGGGTPGEFDSGIDQLHGTGTMVNGEVLVNLDPPIRLDTANLTYFVDIAVRTGAEPGRTVGLRIADPSSDIVFVDGISEIDTLPTTVEFDQIGYILETDSEPAVPTTFTTAEAPDETPPSVSFTLPEDEETGVRRDTIVRVEFTKEMTTINPEDVTIVGSGSGGIDPATDGTFTFNATNRRSFTFTKSTPYVYEETVTVTVSGDVSDNTPLQNPMGEDYVFSFQIAPEVNPTILGTVPSDGSGNVALASTVSLIFSQSMNETTVTDDANFSLVEEGSEPEIAGTMTYNDSANTATFTPDESFDFDTTYVVTVTTGMRDTEGSALEREYTFSFTTTRQIGDFRDAIVANNRIAPDSGEPMRIFVEVPAGSSATDVVTIQVFTATGRRVATLTTAGETYEDIIARQPILWYGTNGRGQELGPGLYFVQVTSAGFRKAMRVLIVR